MCDYSAILVEASDSWWLGVIDFSEVEPGVADLIIAWTIGLRWLLW